MTDLSLFSTEQIAALLKALPDPAFILTRSGRYAAIFGGTDARYYHDGSGLVGKSISDVLNPEKSAWFGGQIALALAGGGLHVVEYPLHRNDIKGMDSDGPDETIWFEGRVQALDHLVAGEDAVLWVASNITASKKLEALLRMQSETDSLSGLANRRKLMAALTEHFDVFARYQTPTSVLIFDIDNFKGINDQYGHAAGDSVLVQVAGRIRRAVRHEDAVGRYGGDEFVAVCEDADAASAASIAERIRNLVNEPLEGVPPGSLVSASVGVVVYTPSQGAPPTNDELLSIADDAMYLSKSAGKDRVSFLNR